MIIKTDLEDYPGGPVVKIHLAVQGMQVQSLVGDPNTTCRRATKAHVPKLLSTLYLNYRSQHTLEPHVMTTDPACCSY